MSPLVQDFRFGFRSLVQRPGFSLVIVLTLALGIGANAAVFSLIDALILRPFPIPDVERLVMVFETVPSGTWNRSSLAPANFRDFQRETDVFEEMAAFHWWEANLTGMERPERLQGTKATPGFLRMLSVDVPVGRDLSGAASDPGLERIAVLSHDLWTRRFGGDASVIGRAIQLNGESYEVVGVAEEGFEYPNGSEVWAPLILTPDQAEVRGSHYLSVIGRLKEGATPEDAQASFQLVASRLAERYPETNEGWGVNVMPLSDAVIDIGTPAFLLVWQATVVFVLLIACVNVANLLLARGADRTRELSLKAALGAGRLRILRQLFAENLTLSLAGAALAVPLAWFGTKMLRDSLPPQIQRFMVGWDQIGLDFRLLAFMAVIAVAAALIFGLAPAYSAARVNLGQVLNESGRSGAAGARQRGRRMLVVAEVAVALMLLVAAGLSIQGTRRLIEQDHGYTREGLLTFEVTLPSAEYPENEQRIDFWERLTANLAARPQVISADVTSILPSAGDNWVRDYLVEGQPAPKPAQRPTADYRRISPGYLETMQVSLLRGRHFTRQDRASTQPVAIVSKNMAERHWPQGQALGKRFRLADEGAEWLTVVGVADNVLHDWFMGLQPTFYRPLAQDPGRSMYVAIRGRGDPNQLTSMARAEVQALDPDQPIHNVRTQEKVVSDRTIGLRYAATMMGIFGAIALVLSVVGIYGVMAYSISRRTREIGIRLAMGAVGGDVLRLTLGGAFRLSAAGIAIGLALAYAAGRFMESTLFGTIQVNVATYALFSAVLLASALLAAYIPSRRALRVDPSEALRVE